MSQGFNYSGKLRIQTEGCINSSIIPQSRKVMSLFYSGTSQIIDGVFLEVPESALSSAH